MQYQLPGETNWNSATILTVDGGSATSPLSSQPGGINHNLLWNAAQNLGLSFTGTVLLRAQATDSETGNWSEPMPYTVNASPDPGSDSDGDGFTDAIEAAFGTNPNIPGSAPLFQSNWNPDGSLTFTWSKAAGRNYRLQSSINLQTWADVQTGLATSTTTIFVPVGSEGTRRYYRMMAE